MSFQNPGSKLEAAVGSEATHKGSADLVNCSILLIRIAL